MNEECRHEGPREEGAVPVVCSTCGGPAFAMISVSRCAACKGDAKRPDGYEHGGLLWDQVVSWHLDSEGHRARSASSSPAPDPFPGVPVRKTRRQKRQKKREDRGTRRRALRALREARETLDILSRSDRALQLRDSAEIARAETLAAWKRYVAIADEGVDWLEQKVDRVSEAASRLRNSPQTVTIPPGALGISPSGSGLGEGST